MTQATDPNLIAAFQTLGAAVVIGAMAWLFVPVLFPDMTRRVIEWLKNTPFPPADPISYSDDFGEPFREEVPLSPEEALRHESLETKEDSTSESSRIWGASSTTISSRQAGGRPQGRPLH